MNGSIDFNCNEKAVIGTSLSRVLRAVVGVWSKLPRTTAKASNFAVL